MINRFATLSVLVLVAVSYSGVASRQAQPQQENCSDSANIIKKGEPLSGAPKVKLADALAAPKLFSGRVLRIDGVVERSCTNEGCWMEVAPKPGVAGVRVTFKDSAFVIPLNAKGMTASAEGRFEVASLSKEQADHLSSEGARLHRNADGSASEVTFIAQGLELRK